MVPVNLFMLLVYVPALGMCMTLLQEEINIFKSYGIEVIEDKIAKTWTLKHHGVPAHGFAGGFGDNPNEPSEQNHTFLIPQIATVVKKKGCVGLGSIGMAISGAPFYNPYTGGGHNAVDGRCEETFDHCSGHPSPDGAYHYHQLPICLYNGTGAELKNRFLGVAFDGYPIYGPMDETGKNWTSAELDQCHGHTHNDRYMYRITREFPYILGCYHGNASIQMSGRRNYGQQQNADDTQPPPNTRNSSRTDGPPPTDGSGRSPPPRNDSAPQRDNQGNEDANQCLNVNDRNWEMSTCYAFCDSPSDGSHDNCTPNQIEDDINACGLVQVTFVVVIVPVYTFVINVYMRLDNVF